MFIPFAPYVPDLPSREGGGTDVPPNALPMGKGYETFHELATLSDALTARAQGAYSTRDADGTVFNFAGDATKLYLLSTTTWGDASRTSGGAYSTGADERWSFTQYGRRVIACNYADATQTFLMGTDTDFSALSGSPPRARYACVIKDFVVLANCSDGANAYPQRVQWGPQGNPTGTWGTDPATLADYQDLDPTYGWIRQIVGGEYGTIFQDAAITRMSFVGSPLAFQFDVLETGKGTRCPGGVVKVGNVAYYIGTDLSFYAFNGSQSMPIGVNRVDKTFQANVDTNYLHRICSCAHPTKPLVFWAYTSNTTAGGAPTSILCYNWSTDRWGEIDITATAVDWMHTAYTPSYTLEDLDSFSASLDALPYSLDSSVWTGGTLQLAGFSQATKKFGYFDGDAVLAWMTTAEFEPNPGGRALITRLMPEVIGLDFDYVAPYIEYRDRQDQDWDDEDADAVRPDGSFPVRAAGRYMRIGMTLSDEFTHATGVRILKMHKKGRR